MTYTSYEKFLYEKCKRLQFHTVTNRLLIFSLIVWLLIITFNYQPKINDVDTKMNTIVTDLEPIDIQVEAIK